MPSSESVQLTLYHGSKVVVNKPEIRPTRRSKDFGQGFYCTKLFQQAEIWATRFSNGHVSRYTYSEIPTLSKLIFHDMTEEWLAFITACRTHQPHTYDIVEGPMADDQVALTVEQYISGEISKAAFWELVKFRKTTHQISFHTPDALDTLIYLDSKEVRR